MVPISNSSLGTIRWAVDSGHRWRNWLLRSPTLRCRVERAPWTAGWVPGCAHAAGRRRPLRRPFDLSDGHRCRRSDVAVDRLAGITPSNSKSGCDMGRLLAPLPVDARRYLARRWHCSARGNGSDRERHRRLVRFAAVSTAASDSVTSSPHRQSQPAWRVLFPELARGHQPTRRGRCVPAP